MEKGHSANGRFAPGNPGRPVGSSKNDLRDQIRTFLSNRWTQLLKWFDELTPKEKITAVIDLLPYAVPRLKQADITIDAKVNNENSTQLIRQEIEKEFDRLFNGSPTQNNSSK